MQASAQRAEKPDASSALIAVGDAPANRCAVCPDGDLEILQPQSLSLVGLGQCDIGFSLCKACGHLQQGPAVPPTAWSAITRFSRITPRSDILKTFARRRREP